MQRDKKRCLQIITVQHRFTLAYKRKDPVKRNTSKIKEG